MAAGFSAWKVNRRYSVNDCVAYAGQQYRCLTSHTSNSASNPRTAAKTWQKYTV